MADIQTVMSFVSMRMVQRTASKIATVLLTATHVKMTHREECAIACRNKVLTSSSIAVLTRKSIGPGRRAKKNVVKKTATISIRSKPLVL